MTRQQSEGEVHVEAMRLILAEMERREDVPDWTIWQHMLNMLETIFQGIENQRDDDRDELMHTRKDRDHWRQARDTAIEGGELLMKSNQTLQAEIETLRKELDEERSVSAGLREQLDAASVTILAQKRGIQYLRLLIDKVRGIVGREYDGREFEDLAEALDEFDHGTIEPTLCPEVERLRAFVAKARQTIGRTMNYCDVEFLLAALTELDAGAEPTPVAEPVPCPKCERLQVELTKSKDWASHCEEVRKDKSAELGFALEECGRLRAFVEKIRDASWNTLRATAGLALAELDAGAEPAPVAEPLEQADGGA